MKRKIVKVILFSLAGLLGFLLGRLAWWAIGDWCFPIFMSVIVISIFKLSKFPKEST